MGNSPTKLLFVFFLLSSCAPVQAVAPSPTVQIPSLTVTVNQPISTITTAPTRIPALTETLAPATTSTLIPCNPDVADFCIVDGIFIFQNPLGSDAPLKIARSYPYGSTDNGRRDPHHGVDIESAEGSPVYAAAAGHIVFAGADDAARFAVWNYFYGNVVVIQHEDGLYTLYGHLSKIEVVVGDQVNSGDLIAAVGHTGVALGSHLHFEVRQGADSTDYFSTQNPELWLVLQGETGALSITLDLGLDRKVQQNLVVELLDAETDASLQTLYLITYPKGFEQNQEDCVLSSLAPGRYRIAFSNSSGVHNRIVHVEAGKLTQVLFDLK